MSYNLVVVSLILIATLVVPSICQNSALPNSLVIGAVYTGDSKINIDTFKLPNGYEDVLNINNIKFTVPERKSVRPICKHDARLKLSTMLGVYDKNNAAGRKIRYNYVFFFDAKDAAGATVLPASFPLNVSTYYDGVIYSYESFKNDMNEIFYWTKVCQNQTLESIPASNLLTCNDGSGKTYKQYIQMFKYTFNTATNQKTVDSVAEFFSKPWEHFNVDLVYGLGSSSTSHDNGVTMNLYVQVAKGKNAVLEPKSDRYVLLVYKNSNVYGILLGGGYTINGVAAGGYLSNSDATVYMLAVKNGINYILSTNINHSNYPNIIIEPTIVKNLGDLQFSNTKQLVYDWKSRQLVFSATNMNNARVVVYYNLTTNAITVSMLAKNYSCLYINRN